MGRSYTSVRAVRETIIKQGQPKHGAGPNRAPELKPPSADKSGTNALLESVSSLTDEEPVAIGSTRQSLQSTQTTSAIEPCLGSFRPSSVKKTMFIKNYCLSSTIPAECRLSFILLASLRAVRDS